MMVIVIFIYILFIYKCEMKICKHSNQLTAWHSVCQEYAPARTVLESCLVGRWPIALCTSLDPVHCQNKQIINYKWWTKK